eukprot:TRINITY_DN12345_c0_g1_i1.p1 TRINITY_DN12345_c0_g1~~TRINITY_DN12345_c0_g1_i1.p1  ORF type:complete len:594 (-),score=240.19 TRINITY_DN12345_c0_g1_i1:57-1838(-)
MMIDTETNETIFPIQVLIDELKNEDLRLRLNSVKRLTTISKAIGPERTRKELIPFLNESVDDEDEVLVALAEELGKMTDLVGGADHAAPSLIPSLQALASVEEGAVRDKAVESLCSIAAKSSKETIQKSFAPLIESLAKGDWFTSRTSACGLFSAVYPRVPDATKDNLRKIFVKLCADETPMVRRSAATHLGSLARQAELEVLKTVLIPAFGRIAKDEQDSVRLLSVANCVSIATRFNELLGHSAEAHQSNLAHVLPVVKSCAVDKSWRVRYMVAENFCELCEAFGGEVTKNELVPAFVELLKDTEAEVRAAISKRVSGVCGLIPEEVALKLVLPCIKEIVTDQSQHVRAALASSVMGIAPIIGREATLQHLDMFLQLLRDDFPEVRLNVISNLESINKVVGIESITDSLLPAIMELAEDRQWRVRLSIIEYIPLLANQLGVELFDDKLGSLCMTWLGDSVYSVREAATINIKKLTEVFGVEWAQSNIIPKVLSLYTHPNFLYRITTLFAVSALAPVVGAEIIQSTMLPLVLRMASDVVPNIRFNVAKTLAVLAPLLAQATVETRIRPCLTQLLEDSDRDVKFYAGQALQQTN